ncbi:hypothetical protein GCM10012280_68810 [Wenjunlia tyrosinilytica]|uniref:Uncharacterized protein n=1 Tax=Wenjunlia tyrosinilytica TaxID=1544741 RepID=A0A917ZYD7_9ACTN|nr:hypothetical protein GCM10012280_68810 [Wenjunlia tyrosinilytica]
MHGSVGTRLLFAQQAGPDRAARVRSAPLAALHDCPLREIARMLGRLAKAVPDPGGTITCSR